MVGFLIFKAIFIEIKASSPYLAVFSVSFQQFKVNFLAVKTSFALLKASYPCLDAI